MIGPLLLIAAIVTLVALSQIFDLRRQEQVRSVMDGVITRRGQNTLDEMTLLVRESRHYLERYHGWAHEHRRAGDYEEAARRLRLGCQAIEELAPDFSTALRKLGQLARCVSAIVVVEPVRAYAFRTWRLRGLAGVGAVLHYLLLTGRQRVLLRLGVVASAFRLALRWLRSSTSRIERRDSAGEWRRVDALVADLGASGDEALVAARQIVQALDAVDFSTPVARGARS